MRLRTTVYRAHNPRWSFAPLSGAGAVRYGGRFNPTGMEALYTSRRFETAWLEAQQGFAFKAQPLTLITYDVDCDDVADLTQAATCAGLGVSGNDLGCAWEDLVSRGIDPPSWQIARRLYNDGTAAIIVPSYAPGANEDDINVFFWRWSDIKSISVRTVDENVESLGVLASGGSSKPMSNLAPEWL